jgi:hypothetical protein
MRLALGAFALVLVASGCSENPVVFRDALAPASPQALYSVTGDGSVTLYWVRNTERDLAGYRVYIAPAYNGPYTPLSTTSATSYVVGSLTNGTTSYFAVAAYDDAGNESDLSTQNVNDTPRPAGTGVVLGTATAEPAAASGYDFSSGTLRLSGDPLTDMYFDLSGGARLMYARDLQTDIQDAGYHVLDDLDWAPSAGWSPTGSVELTVGHSYYLVTRDNHYAKFRVVAVSNTSVQFDWAYQIDADNPQLARPPRAGGKEAMGEKRAPGA